MLHSLMSTFFLSHLPYCFSSITDSPTWPPTTIADYEDINSRSLKSDIFNQILDSSNYDTKLRPPGVNNGSGPTDIAVSLYIRSIENIDDNLMQYSVQLTFRQEWLDPRLNYSHLEISKTIRYLQLLLSKRIWMPDLFFSNEKKGELHNLLTPNLFTRIYPNGTVLQSYRITLLLSCPMDLRFYPLDVQSCPIQMASYGWTTQDLRIKWKQTNDAVKMADNFQMPRFRMQNHKLVQNCFSLTSSGNYSCIRLDISFVREFGFYLIQIYIPCSMLCLVSWVTFWLEPTAVEARVSLGVTTILATVAQTYGINQSAPPASYVKAMDVWTAFCQAMVFGSLLEFAVVNYIARFITNLKVITTPINPILNQQKGDDTPTTPSDQTQLISLPLITAQNVDRLARLAFPIVFILFNIAYWMYYLRVFH